MVKDVTTISSKTGSARVLTSDECWSLYKVKEEKKKCEAEEKEKRKRKQAEEEKAKKSLQHKAVQARNALERSLLNFNK